MNCNKKQILDIVIFILLCVFIFYSPFPRGLFFVQDKLLNHILSTALFLIFIISRHLNREKIQFDNPINIISFILIIAYLLPIIFSTWVNINEAIIEALRYINLFAIYIIVNDYAKNTSFRKVLINTIIISGIFITLIALFSASGYIDYYHAFRWGRLASVFQYPNTFAAFTMTLFFLCFAMYDLSKNILLKFLYGLSGFLMVFSFVLTYSRAAWLIFPSMLLIFFLTLPPKPRINLMFYSLSIIITVIILLQPFTELLGTQEGNVQFFTIFIISIILYLFISIIFWFLNNRIKEKDYYKIYTALIILLFLFATSLFLALTIDRPLVLDNYDSGRNRTITVNRTIRNLNPDSNYYLLFEQDTKAKDPSSWTWEVRFNSYCYEAKRQVLERVRSLDHEEKSVEIPFNTSEDTEYIEISFANRLRGTRAELSNAKILDDKGEPVKDIILSYRFIPERLVRRFHSIDLESGGAGGRFAYYKDSFKIFRDHPIIGLGGGAWNEIYRYYQSRPYSTTEAHNYFAQTMVEVGLFGLIPIFLLLVFIFKLIINYIKDFKFLDLCISFSIVTLMIHSFLDFNFSYLALIILFWVLLALLDKKSITFNKKAGLNPLYLLIFIIPLTFSLSFYTAYNREEKAINLLKDGKPLESMDSYLKAVSYNPFEPTIRAGLASIARQIGINRQIPEYLNIASDNILKAIENAPHSMLILEMAIDHYMSIKDFDNANKYIEYAINTNPMLITPYVLKIRNNIIIGNYFIENRNLRQGYTYFNKALETIGQIRRLNENITRKLTLDADTMGLLQYLMFYVDNIREPARLRMIDSMVYSDFFNVILHGDQRPTNWRTWQRLGGNIDYQVTDNGLKITNNGNVTALFYSRNFTLNQETDYKIILNMDYDHEKSDFLRLRIFCAEEAGNQIDIRNFEEHYTGRDYTFNFKTTKDLVPGYQQIRINHNGNTEEGFVLRSILIIEE